MFTKSFLIKIVKRILIALGILIVLCIFLGFLFYKDVKGFMVSQIQDYIAEIEYGDLEIEDIEMVLLQHFPNISVRLRHINFYEKKDSLREKDQSPILYAENIYLDFAPWELIRNKNLKVTTISIEEGVLDLFMYEDNKTNLEKAFSKPQNLPKANINLDSTALKVSKPKKSKTSENQKKPEAGKKLLVIDLKAIDLDNITLKYNNPGEKHSSEVQLASLDGTILLNTQGISCDIETSFEITKSAKLPSIAEQKPASLSLNLDYIDASQQIVIHKGALNFENVSVDIKGTYNHKNGNYIDMQFDASSNDMAFLSKLIQEDILEQNMSSIQNADIVLNGQIKGKMEDNFPKIDLNFGVKDLSMKGPAGKGKFNNVGFDGELHTGEAADFSTAILSLRNLRGETPGGSVSGNFFVKNFQHPYLKSNVNISLDLDGYDDIFQFSTIDSLKGKINFTSDFDGLLNLENKLQMDSIGSWSFQMKDIGFKYNPSEKTISKFNGTISESRNEVSLNNLSMEYDSSNMTINGRIKNLYHFLFNKEQELEADLEVKSSQLYTSHFILNPNSTALINDRIRDFETKVKVTGSDNDAYDSYFPSLNIELQHMSFELDKLPGLSKLEGLIKFSETETGFNVAIPGLHAELPIGSADILGNVVIPDDFRTLDVNAELKLNNIPEEYVSDLIREMNDGDLLNAKNISADKLTIVNGNLNVSGVLETVPFALRKTAITNSNIILRLADSTSYEVNNLSLKLDSLRFNHFPGSYRIVGIEALTGRLHADAINTSSIPKIPIDIDFNAANDQFNLDFSSLRESGNQDKGSLFLDIAKTPPDFEFTYDLVDISIESVLEDYTDRKLMEGTLNASLQFTGSGTNWEEVSTNLRGTVNMTGDSLILYGIDIDNLLRKYQRTQKFNLADVSAIVLAGPIGIAVTKGANFTSLIATADLKPEDKTYVSKVITRWSVDHGVLKTEDAAFSTSSNRLAFEGEFDFINDSIPGFTAYVLDKKGCSLMEQRIYGKMGSVKSGNLKIAKTLLGSVINFINSVVGDKCEPVYQGEVLHPIPIK